MKMRLILAGLWILLGWYTPVTLASPVPAPLFDSIGDGGFKADTQDALAQKYFNQGMVFFYGFDYLESIRSFEASVKLDKNCARCQFGLALSLGSVTNAFVKGDELDRANHILAQAKTDDPVTHGLFEALRLRYQPVSHAALLAKQANGQLPHCAESQIELPAKNKLAFTNSLFELTQKFPEDQTIQTLFAYSVLGTENWELYDSLLGIKPYTRMMIDALKHVLNVNPNHLGAIHLYIHATEWSKDPAASLNYAENLPNLAPLAEHLVHMPVHIYFRLGEYHKGVNQSLQAIKAYEDYAAICRQQGFDPGVNFLNQHNYDFLFTAAIFSGRADVAYQAAEDIRKETPVAWLSKEVFFQRFYALKFYAIAHFGGWEHLTPLEKPLQKYPYLKAMWAYAKGLHALQSDNISDFDRYFKKFIRATDENNAQAPYKKAFANNLAIAKEVLLANKERQASQWEKAIYHWHTAVSLQKAGGEPPEWYFSPVLGLGYAFLDAHKPKQAILTFETSLNNHPENGWALYGLAKAYEALNQTGKAHEMQSRFNKIWDTQSIALPIKQGSDLFLSSK